MFPTGSSSLVVLTDRAAVRIAREILKERVVPLLPPGHRPRALHVITGVLDWDLASLSDPADDVAALATWHGWRLVEQLADADTVARATALRRTYGLQIVAFALLHDRPDAEVERAIERGLKTLTW